MAIAALFTLAIAAVVSVAQAQSLTVVNSCTESVFLYTQNSDGTIDNDVTVAASGTANMGISSDWDGAINVGTGCNSDGWLLTVELVSDVKGTRSMKFLESDGAVESTKKAKKISCPNTSSQGVELNEKSHKLLKKPSFWSKISKTFKGAHTQHEPRLRPERCEAPRRPSRRCKSMADLGNWRGDGSVGVHPASHLETLPRSGSISDPLAPFSRYNPSTQLQTDRWCQVSCRLDLEDLPDFSFDDVPTSSIMSVEAMESDDALQSNDNLCASSVTTSSNTTAHSISTVAPSDFYSAGHKNVSLCELAVSPTFESGVAATSETNLHISGPSESDHRMSRYAWVSAALQSIGPAKKTASCEDLSSTLHPAPESSQVPCPSRPRRSASISDLRSPYSVVSSPPQRDVANAFSPLSTGSMTPPSLSHILDLDRNLGNVWGLTQEDVTLDKSAAVGSGALPKPAEALRPPPAPALVSSSCHMPYTPGCRLSTISEASETVTVASEMVASEYHHREEILPVRGRYVPLGQPKPPQNATPLRSFSVPSHTMYMF
ncbi:hypothetical protein CONPUDRAFT_145080 [Coniophora puteana RWD-64-598 SS2]|uniref:Uncharacterized protein n=1 Tax=Coniophora puteana (strain RWD-64-598) TaxID=741705 RepID=A0A5M3MM37_CONPW|nr:uncharacterized protein CONPUDRAFT_145080 [Coniophora puteana RWD-64-598 SS2]EIW80080.1 hypothetical protein CONPUDRAFT_145080 [Coniophora puteana RWD-64-598 SS2]